MDITLSFLIQKKVKIKLKIYFIYIGLHCMKWYKTTWILIEVRNDTKYRGWKWYAEYDLLRCINCGVNNLQKWLHYTSDDMVQIPNQYGDHGIDSCPNYYPTRDIRVTNTTHIINLLPDPIQDTFNEVVTAQ